MKKVLLVAFAALFAMSGSAWAGDDCSGCSGIKVGGYIAPNFRMIDTGESAFSDEDGNPIDNVNNMGFGVAFARFNISGMHEVGDIIKKIGWKLETDIKQPGVQGLVYAYVDAYLNDEFAVRFGRHKKPFGREWLHPTPRLLTVDRHLFDRAFFNMLDLEYSGHTLSYGAYSYGLTFMCKQEMFSLMAGVYDGQGSKSFVGQQDPVLDFGLRGVVTPTDGLEIGANVALKSLPGGMGYWDDDEFEFDPIYGDWDYIPDAGAYVDIDTLYQTNSAMALGFDAEYKSQINEEMSIWAQAEFGMGDNWLAGPEFDVKTGELVGGENWEDWSWYKFQYFYVKALFMATEMFGVHLGISQFDPNTSSDSFEMDTGQKFQIGENNELTKITPGITINWSGNTRTQIEVQLITRKVQDFDYDVDTDKYSWVDDDKRTNFVIQQVVIF
ncbi:MAG: hypothetical protein KAY32_06005 [Candidatus Eisenbacteria sp.]|nr:hypothetical protein [Candidatus Eisenbacteria bacterium]